VGGFEGGLGTFLEGDVAWLVEDEGEVLGVVSYATS